MKQLNIRLVLLSVLFPILLTAQESIITLNTNHTGATHDKVARCSVFLKPGFSYKATTGKSFWAHIDPTLPQPPITAINYIDPATLPIETDQSLPVGAITGQSGVSATGAANYTIPIEVPPAAQGMQPNLSLVYNSQAGNGIMGIGWNLAGLSAITRVPKNIYNDGKVEEIKLDATDNFALDGQRLIRTAGNQGEANSEYHTEVETFVKVTAQGTSGNGPLWFKVETKDGLTMEFGNSVNAILKKGGSSTILTWHLNKVYDRFGNVMEYKWKRLFPWDRNSIVSEVYLSSIEYGGNTNQGNNSYNKVQFQYAERDDVIRNRIANIGNLFQSIILKKIEIINNKNFVKGYTFEYKNDSITKLVSIDLVGAQAEHLNKTIIDWGSETNPVAFSSASENTQLPRPAPPKVSISVVDFNGDSKLDLIYKYDESNTWYLFIFNNLSNSYDLKHSGTLNNVIQLFTGDINSDGSSSVFIVENASGSDKLKEYSYNNTSGQLELINTTNLPSTNCKTVQFGDFNGDAVQDIIAFDADNNVLGIILGEYGTTISMNPVVNPKRVELVDAKGNGKTDIMIVDNNWASTIWELNGSNTYFSLIKSYNNFPGSETTWLKGDFNGDKRTDFLFLDSNEWKIFYTDISQSGYTVQGNLPFTHKRTTWPSQTLDLTVIDMNHDGYDDVFEQCVDDTGHSTTDASGVTLFEFDQTRSTYFNTSNGKFITKRVRQSIYKSSYFKGRQIILCDINNDLMIDILEIWRNVTPTASGGYVAHRSFYNFLGKNFFHTNLVISIRNGASLESKFTYSRPIAKNNTNPNIFIEYLNRPPIYTVDNFTSESGSLISTNQSFVFTTPYIHKQGKGFLGFSDIEMNDNILNFTAKTKYQMETSVFNSCIQATGNKSSSNFLEKTLYSPLLTKSIILDSNNDTISKTTYKTDVDITDPCLYLDYELFYVNPKSKIEKNYLQNLTTTTNYTYDDYGNPLTVTVDYNGNATTQTTNTYTGFGNWWHQKSRLRQSTVTKSRPGETDFTATTWFDYNTQGALTTTKSFYNQPKQVTKSYSNFDNFGNPKTTQISASGLDTRQTLLEYDTYGRFVTKQTNPLGHITQFTYDGKTGNLLTLTDANGLITTNYYDGFGRLENIHRPDGNTTEITRHWNIAGNQLYYTQKITSGQPEQRTYYDVLGRNIKSGAAGFDGTMVYTENIYDAKGQLWKTSEPFKTTATQYTVYEYLNNGRLNKITYPTGVTRTYSYPAGSTKTTQTSSNGTWKTTEKDGTGALTMAKDAAGEIDYTYFAHGGIKNIIFDGNTTAMGYDDYGRQTSLTDPDAGNITYTYNAFGELTGQTDAKGNSYSMEYDKLGRIKTKKLGATTVADYTYDNAPGKAIGLLAKIEGDNNITYTYEYDNLARPVKKTENIQGTTFNIETGYNSHSQINKVVYPKGYIVENMYQNGYISSVTGINQNSVNIYTATGYNTRGQITGYNLGNGKTTTKSYNGYGFLTGIATPGIQNLQYNFNTQTGNLNWRKDAAKNITENFTYDNLMKNRLESCTVGATTTTNQYLANGNIDTKTGLGHFAYNGTQPHAVTGIDNTDIIVDPEEQTIDYTPFNKVQFITEGDYRLQIIYGPDNQRKKTVLYHNANAGTPLAKSGINWVAWKTRYFVGGIYEEELIDAITDNTREINYITGGDGLAAIFEKNNQGENLYYIHKDHLGSYQAVSDNNGNLVEELSFGPWGRRRKATDWEDYSLTTPPMFARGFTGHEHLPEFNLINMNGRVYDPILGRFLSPDNYIQLPNYTQSLNRYSYALNNPLKYTDPSGNSFLGLLFRAIAGNYLMGVGDNWINKGMSLKDAFKATTIVAGTNFSPSNFTQQHNYGFSNPQVDAHNLVGYEKEYYKKLNQFISSQSGRRLLVEDIWNSRYMRAQIPDFISVGIGFSGIVATGGNSSIELRWVTRGPEASLLPAVTTTQSVGAGYQIDAMINIEGANYFGDVKNIRREMMQTHSATGDMPAFWGSGGFTAGGKIGITGYFIPYEGSLIIGRELNIGVGLPAGIFPVNGAMGVSNTWILHDFYNYNK
jgi:RHS repeat-associated protein